MIWGKRSANYITRPYCQSLSIVSRVGQGGDARLVAKNARPKRKTPIQRIGVFGILVASLGIEPRTRGFSIRCSTN